MLNHINSPDKLLYFYLRAAWVEDNFTKKLKQHQRPSCDLFVAISKIPLPFTTGTCFKHLMQVKYQLLLIHIIENQQNVKLWEKKTSSPLTILTKTTLPRKSTTFMQEDEEENEHIATDLGRKLPVSSEAKSCLVKNKINYFLEVLKVSF